MKYFFAVILIFLLGCDNNKEKLHMNMPPAPKHEKCDVEFNAFFKKFSRDSVFQKLHVKFPLKKSHLDNDYNDLVREDIPLSKYTFIDFGKHKDAMKQEQDKFNVKLEKQKDSVFYFMSGYDNGIMIEIKFSYTNQCWQLVEIIDQST